MSVTPVPAGLSLPEQRWNTTTIPLGDTIRALAHTVRGQTDPSAGQSWRAHLSSLLGPLREAFAQHRAATEGDLGLYADVVSEAPRLARTVDGLVAEHYALDSAIARLARSANEVNADSETLRHRAKAILDGLTRHRQHDADLVYEAYSTDIGGE
jgi:hypothetical protein